MCHSHWHTVVGAGGALTNFELSVNSPGHLVIRPSFNFCEFTLPLQAGFRDDSREGTPKNRYSSRPFPSTRNFLPSDLSSRASLSLIR